MQRRHEFRMAESFTIFLCILALAFVAALAAVVVLAFYLARRKKRSGSDAAFSDDDALLMEPFAKLEHKTNLNGFYNHRYSEISIAETEEELLDERTSRLTTQITFSLFHIPNDERLVLDVWSVVDAPSDFSTGYVEAQLFPSDFEAGQFRTNDRESIDDVIIFNESFLIPDVTIDVLTRVHLKLFLYSACHDGLAQPQCVGHTVFSLCDIQLNPLGKTQFQKELIKHEARESLPAITDEQPSTPSRGKGELYISLRYQKKSGRINVVVLKAENIQKGKMLQNEPYVKIKLLYQGDVADKKQTKARKRTSNPCWNQPFVFNVDEEKGLDNYELVFLLRRRDLISPHSSLGFVRIGAQVGGGGQSHWYAMMAKGNLMRQVARCHKIQ